MAVILICGPPCAGKSTHAARYRGPDDAVLDQDVIGAAAMDRALRSLPSAPTVWVIRAAPGQLRRDHLAGQLGADRTVLLVPGRRILMRRAQSRPHPRRAVAAIEDWFARERLNAAPRAQASPYRKGPRSRHRTGRPYLRARQEMFRRHGTVCHLCGHEGATDADHVMPVSVDPSQPVSSDSLLPAHGVKGCPTCGRACNQARGNRVSTLPQGERFRRSRAW